MELASAHTVKYIIPPFNNVSASIPLSPQAAPTLKIV